MFIGPFFCQTVKNDNPFLAASGFSPGRSGRDMFVQDTWALPPANFRQSSGLSSRLRVFVVENPR
jgi:hypothetical protein